jgi:hypothetical protein
VRFVTCAYAIFGMSAAISVRNVGAPVPEVGPANIVWAPCVFKLNDNAGVLVGFATLVVNTGDRLPELKFVSVPLAAPGKVWPAAKVIIPVFAIDSPVRVGVQLGLLLQNIKLTDGVGEACSPKVFVDDAPLDCRLKRNEFLLAPVPLGGITKPPAAAELLPRMFMPLNVLP